MATPRGILPEGFQGQCPYSLLGLFVSNDGKTLTVQDAASDEESVKNRETLSLKAIGTAYRRAALKAHPDKNKGRETDAAAEFVRVNLAFAFLADQAQRESYHAHLRALLSLRQQREEQRRRWTQRDREKQRFKDELERREAEALKAKHKSEEDILKQIREQNEELLRRKQHEIELARRLSFRDNLLLRQHHQLPLPSSFARGETETADDAEEILYRSLLLSWPTVAAKSETGHSEGFNAGGPDASKAGLSTDLPTPASLSAFLWKHGAIDLCFFSKSRGMACVSFTSRERAVEAALLLQNQRKRKDKNGWKISVKLANKAKGFEVLLRNVRNAADVFENLKEEQGISAQPESAEGCGRNEQDATVQLARETQEAAATFAAEIAAAQESKAGKKPASEPGDPPHSVSAMQSTSDPVNIATSNSSRSNPSGMTSAAELRTAAAAFGLGSAHLSQPASCAASRILAYIRTCSERGEADARVKQAELQREEGWEWLGGSKVAANMSMEQLEAAAFGALERKKHQQQKHA